MLVKLDTASHAAVVSLDQRRDNQNSQHGFSEAEAKGTMHKRSHSASIQQRRGAATNNVSWLQQP